MNEIKNITLIGAGNVATHLGKHLIKKGLTINGVFNRNSGKGGELALKLDSQQLKNLTFIPKNTDLVLVCVTDDEIANVLKEIPDKLNVAYTSGSIKIENLSHRKNLGVFYPLQTFSIEKQVALDKVPFFIEANEANFGQQLFSLAKKISTSVQYASSEERFHLHIAAVMVNNFVNHLYTLANEHLEENQLNLEHLIPLIEETTSKINEIKPFEAQTGPAKRNDQEVIKKHLTSLTGTTKEIYALLSKSIQEKHAKK
jgi:predicted short-subunit dehydrogenase-like oxidoreductase (DUF2520 family)